MTGARLRIKPKRRPARQRVNTPLSRRLARMWEQETGQPLPGGIENACIQRTRAGHWQRSAGAWYWFLYTIVIDGAQHAIPEMGSQWPARECVKDPSLLDWQ